MYVYLKKYIFNTVTIGATTVTLGAFGVLYTLLVIPLNL